MNFPKNFLIITHVPHIYFEGKYWAYGPYVKEMNLWAKKCSSVSLLAPISDSRTPNPIDLSYNFPSLNFIKVKGFELTSFGAVLKAMISLPSIGWRTWKEIKKSDHIHLRCPGNMGLIGAIIQIFFPSKTKTAKYAANWDPNSSQPFSYVLQKRILSSKTFSKNMKVLTYGDWDPLNSNLVPFFTATYSENEVKPINPRPLNSQHQIQLLFVGGLQKAKNPLLSIIVCQKLLKEGFDVVLNLYGQGPEMESLIKYVEDNNLKDSITFHGNVAGQELKKAYQDSHFLIFVSKSEGWPKVVAEAMFWACLPITSPVSCVPQMLGNETRGDLVAESEDAVCSKILGHLNQPEGYFKKSKSASEWSQKYTLEKFENEIHNLLTC